MSFDVVTSFFREKYHSLVQVGQWFAYLEDLRVVMALVGLAVFWSALALLLLTRSHCRLRRECQGAGKPQPAPEKMAPVPSGNPQNPQNPPAFSASVPD